MAKSSERTILWLTPRLFVGYVGEQRRPWGCCRTKILEFQCALQSLHGVNKRENAPIMEVLQHPRCRHHMASSPRTARMSCHWASPRIIVGLTMITSSPRTVCVLTKRASSPRSLLWLYSLVMKTSSFRMSKIYYVSTLSFHSMPNSSKICFISSSKVSFLWCSFWFLTYSITLSLWDLLVEKP